MAKKKSDPAPEQQAPPRPEIKDDELVRLGRYLARHDRITRAAAVERIRRLDTPALEQLRKHEAAARPPQAQA